MKFVLLILFIISCGYQKDRLAFNFVGITKEELTSKKGSAKSEDTLENKDQILTFADGVQFQINDNKVISKNREPTAIELNLNYWKLQFANESCQFKSKIISTGHEQNHLYECKEVGISVIYSVLQKRVIRVLEYAKAV